ncbi:MAG: CAP domain-containing protein [Candidatus Falkowbacteria bacterium]
MAKKIKWPPDQNPADFLDYLNSQFGTIDSDHDGITDEVELMIGTDPHKFDTDGDGMGDGEEIRQGRNPLGPGNFADFFKAHEGNDFHPHALHPKRVLFYVASATVVKAMALIVAIAIPASAWLAPDALTNQAKQVVKLTNEQRAKAGVGALVVDKKLEQGAYNKAQDMIINQYFAHTSPQDLSLAYWLKKVGYHYMVAGENLAMGFTDAPSMMEAWEKSPTHFANIIDPDYSQIGVAMQSGLYQGEPTIMAVQFFGFPKQLIIKDKVSRLPMQQEATVQTIPAVSPVISTAVLGVKETGKDMAEPQLISPADGAIVNHQQVTLQIAAPGAASVKVLLNGQSAGLAMRQGQDFVFVAPLSDGLNKLELVARSGGTQKSTSTSLVLDQAPPKLLPEQTHLYLERINGQEILLRAQVSFDGAVQQVFLKADGDLIPLAPDPINPQMWSGNLLAPVSRLNSFLGTLPVLSAVDLAGNKGSFDVAWSNTPAATNSWFKQYRYLRQGAVGPISHILSLTNWYLRAIMLLAIVASIFALGVGWRKARKALSLGVLMILACLILLLI